MKRYFFFSFVVIILYPFKIYSQWFQQKSGTKDLLYSIQFVDNNNGWVTNLNGTKLFHTTNGGSDWFVQKDFGSSTIWNFTFLNDSVGYSYSHGIPAHLYKTTDGGNNWKTIYTFSATLDNLKWYDENIGWGISTNLTSSLIKTTNGGLDWQGFDSLNSYNEYLGKVGIIDEKDVIVTSGTLSGENAILKTTNGGISWAKIPVADTLLSSGRIQFINSFTGWIESSGNLYKTLDGGLNWKKQVSSSLYDFFFLNENDGWYVAGNQINRTTNGGQNWILQNSGTENILYTIYFLDQNNGWISGDSGTVLFTSNEGLPVELTAFTAELSRRNVILNWETATETNNMGFEIQRTQIREQSLTWDDLEFIKGNGTTTEQKYYSFIDKELKPGKYYYRLKQIDYDGSFKYSNKIKVNLESPKEFTLNQNYPNPFNPSTAIKYSTTNAGIVTLKVYDVLGNEVATLVNEEKQAGSYSVKFDGSKFSSGVYFYQLTAGSFIQTKKLVLLK